MTCEVAEEEEWFTMATAVSFLLPLLAAIFVAAGLPLHLGRAKLIAAAIASLVLYELLVIGMPFWGIVTESIVAVAAAAALVPAMLILRRVNAAVRERGRSAPWPVFLVLPLLACVMVPWTARVFYRSELDWECNGQITSKYRSHNHSAPAFKVKDSEGEVTLDGVDASAWESSKPGDELVKRKGSAFGTLQGKRLRLVPRRMHWWYEPQ